MNLPDTKGVLVSEVVADAPAEKAGIEDGDVITAVNGQRTEGVEQFRQQVADFAPGTTISVALVRDGDGLTRRVKLTEFPVEQAEASAPVEDQAAKWLGLSVRALTGDERDRANVRSGVVVSAIQVGSAAAEAGIERGDIILEAGSEKISGMADYSRIARAYSRSGDPVLLRIMRGSNKLFIAVEPTE
jgi:serine protease Do